MLPTNIVQAVAKLCSIRSKNVVAVYGIVTKREPQVVMEHISQGSLLDFLKNETVDLDNDLTLRIARDIIAGVSMLHVRSMNL